MLAEARSLVAGAHALVDGLDPDAIDGAEARELVETFAALERLAAAGRTLVTTRVDQTGAWIGDGTHRDLPSWLASVTGTTVGAARAATDIARQIRELPATTAALRAGALSPAQTQVIAAAATADPSEESRLIAHAATSGLKGLRTECDRVTAAAASAEEQRARAERVHRARALRHCRGTDGSGRLVVTGPLDRTAELMAALEPYEQDLFDEHRRAGDPEHPDAIAFDALMQLVADASDPTARKDTGRLRRRGSRPLGTVVVHVSLDAYLRGSVAPGEICEIRGAGPVPVSAAHRIAADAFIRAVVENGTDVLRVSHLGRSTPTHVLTAVETRSPTCVIEGCEVDRHLEIDHNVPVAALGPTDLANIDPVCGHHHDLKTRRDLRRLGPRGRQRLVTVAEYEVAMAADAERAPPEQLAG